MWGRVIEYNKYDELILEGRGDDEWYARAIFFAPIHTCFPRRDIYIGIVECINCFRIVRYCVKSDHPLHARVLSRPIQSSWLLRAGFQQGTIALHVLQFLLDLNAQGTSFLGLLRQREMQLPRGVR
jgi:hypothetical protein